MSDQMTDVTTNFEDADFDRAPDRPKSALELRLLFRSESADLRRSTARSGVWIAVLIYLLFSITDALFIPDVALETIAARFCISVLALVAIEVLYRRRANAEWLEISCAITVVAGYAAWLLPAMTTEMTQTLSYYMVFGAIFMLGANLFFKLRFWLSITCSLAILTIFFIALYNFPAGDSYRLAFGMFYLACFAFTSFVNWNLNEERFNVFVNALEARTQHEIVTERGRALYMLARTDPLTGLENRRVIDDKLRAYWSDWQLSGRKFAAILVDVDFFKKYNDFYGHQAGDQCLVHLAAALSDTIKPYNASIGRYGGEEFIVLMRAGSEARLAQLVEDIRQTVVGLAIPHEDRRDGTEIVTVSIGASYSRFHAGAKLEKIIHEADRALYSAKASGRNCGRVFDPTDPQTDDQSENIAALLKLAIDRDLVSLVYQPIQSLSSGESFAVEALMRLKMLDGTVVPPNMFIPIAEKTGTILELGRWAIKTVCREILQNRQFQIASVNVSPVQLKAPGFAASVAAILSEMGIRGNRLAFEITEGLEMDIHSDILRCISDLKRLGIRIWLDDFGTGFAGLSWLRLIDFDTVKIDRSFLHDSGNDRGHSMLDDIVSLVRNRGPQILVEGVETEAQLERMRTMGIDLVQGFFVGRPMPATYFATAATPQLTMRTSRPPLKLVMK